MNRGLKSFLGFLLVLIRWTPSWAVKLQNLTLDSPRLNVGDTLVSPSGHLELGIFNYPATGSKYYMCVRYAEPIEQAVVWVANREIPLSQQSYLELSSPGGDLQLSDPNNNVARIPWSSSTANVGVGRAELHDLGNLVLVDNTGIQIWDSFRNGSITDTLLPGQYLNRTGRKSLTSWLSTDDPGLGNGTYTFGWGTRGNKSILQLAWTSPKVFSDWRGGAYIPGQDDTNPHVIPDVEFVYFDSLMGNLYFPSTPADTGHALRYKRVVTHTFSGDSISATTLKRLTLDTDGGLRIWQWNIGTSKTWTAEANWVVAERGSQCYTIGTCGSFSQCTMTPFGALGRVNCACPYGHYAEDPSRGCTAVVPLSDSDLCNEAKVNLTVLPGVDMPWGGGHKNLTGEDSVNCREACLKDCKCAGAVYSKKEQYCRTGTAPLYNLGYPTEKLHGNDRTAFIKISLYQPPPPPKKRGEPSAGKLVWWKILVVVAVAVIVLGLVGLCVYRFTRRGNVPGALTFPGPELEEPNRRTWNQDQ